MFLPRDIIRFETSKSAKHFSRLGPPRVSKEPSWKRDKHEEFAAAGNRARVIWVRDNWAFLFNMECPKTEIWKCQAQQLTRMHLDGIITRQDEDRSWVQAAEALSSKKQIERREKLLAAIASLLAETPSIFESAYRGHAVATQVPIAKMTAKTLHTALHRYWL